MCQSWKNWLLFLGDESSCLSLWDTKSYASALQLCCLFFNLSDGKQVLWTCGVVWSHMDYKFPLAVFYGSIDLNFVRIASPVSPSLSPTAPLHFMATLLPEYVHLPVWIWLMAFMFFFGSFALLFLWEKILYWTDNGEKTLTSLLIMLTHFQATGRAHLFKVCNKRLESGEIIQMGPTALFI